MSKTKTVMVDKVGGISYPENFIEANQLATFGDTVSGTLKDLTFTDGITINKNQLSAGGEYGSSIIFDGATLNVAGYNRVYINGFGSGVAINSEGGNISLNSNHNKIVASSPVGIVLTAPKVSISDTFVIPVYTENTDGTYTKIRKTVSLRVVERDGDYTIVIDDN